MNILFVITRKLIPAEKGDVRLAYYRAQYLHRANQKVTILAFIISPWRSRPLIRHVPIPDCDYLTYIEYHTPLITSLFSVFSGLSSGLPFQSLLFSTRHARKYLLRLISLKSFDRVHLFTLRAASFAPLIPNDICVLDLIDSMHANYISIVKVRSSGFFDFLYKLLLHFELPRIFQLETNLSALSKNVLLVSRRDIRHIRSLTSLPQKVNLHHIPIGMEISEHHSTSKCSHTPVRLLFFGTLSYTPNVEAAHFLLTALVPLLEQKKVSYELVIAGRNCPRSLQLLSSQIPSVTLISPATSIPDLLRTSDISLSPVFSGSGTQFKVIETLASGTPLIASDFCATPLALQHGRDCLIANTAEEYYANIVRLQRDQILFRRLGKNGITLSSSYSWSSTVKSLLSCYSGFTCPGS